MAELGSISGSIKIDYDNRGVATAKRDITGLEGPATKTTGLISSVFHGMAVGVGIAITQMVKSAAEKIAGMVTDSIKSFGSFETGMNEVFTLLPDISGKAMGKMTQQTLDTAKEMRVMPEEVVPALYSALSAGVPPDNVFDFLIQSNKLAKGGATDLDTAVSTMSATVNAYGDDVIDAEQVSDLLFTAVKGGITTVDELGGSLSNVVPTAAGLGVEFGNITAALASMTSQGTPTATATTQLRQLLVELSKEGGKAANTFEDIAGKSFREFIDGGGDMQEALQLMQTAAKDNDVSITDLFGSVEAGNAALQLTGAGTEKFTQELEKAKDAAGATDVAYDQMAQGLSHAWDGVKVSLDAFLKKSLIKLAPIVTDGIEKIGESFLWLQNNAVPIFQSVSGEIERFETPIKVIASLIAILFIPHWIALGVAAVVSAVKQVGAWFATQAASVKASVAHSIAVSRMVIGWVIMGAAAVRSGAQTVAIWALIQASSIRAIAAQVAATAAVVGGWIAMGTQATLQAARMAIAWLVALGPIGLLIAAVTLIVGVIVFLATKTQFFQTIWEFIWGKIGGVVKTIRDLIVAYLNSLLEFWTGVWNGIVAVFTFIFNLISGGIKRYIGIWKAVITAGLNFIRNVWNAAWNFFKAVFEAAWKVVSTLIRTYINTWKAIISAALNFIKSVWNAAWNNVRSVINAVINAIRSIIQSGINRVKSIIAGVVAVVSIVRNAFNRAKDAAQNALNTLISTVKGIPGRIKSALGRLGSLLFNAGKDVIRGLINGIKNMASRAAQAAKDAVKGAIDGAKGLLGIGSPSKVFDKEVGEMIPRGLAQGVKRTADIPRREVEAMVLRLTATPAPTLRAVATGGAPRGTDGASVVYNFGEGSIVLDASKMKSIDDLVKMVDDLRPTARQFVRKS